MSYTFSVTNDVGNIKEQEYGNAGEIRFSKFTSCIGLVAREGNTVTGVHLVMLSKTDTAFDKVAADEAVKLLGKYSKVVVIGHTDMWSDNLNTPYCYLLSKLTKPNVMNVNDGVYGGKVENGLFKIYQNGNYVIVP